MTTHKAAVSYTPNLLVGTPFHFCVYLLGISFFAELVGVASE